MLTIKCLVKFELTDNEAIVCVKYRASFKYYDTLYCRVVLEVARVNVDSPNKNS